jgi:hypothetical protein
VDFNMVKWEGDWGVVYVQWFVAQKSKLGGDARLLFGSLILARGKKDLIMATVISSNKLVEILLLR